MSSTYAHHQGASSLPSDYAVSSESDSDSSHGDTSAITQKNRRVTSERTPLLSNPPVSRIEEPVDNNDSRAPTFWIFWEEFLILAKYSFPVFMYYLRFSKLSLDLTILQHIHS